MKGFFKFLFRIFFFPDKPFLFKLIRILGYFPDQIALYQLAFIHKSAGLTDQKGHPLNNERLEYLGDAILGSVIAAYLYHHYPYENEGFLTKMRSKIVNGSHLSQLAVKMDLDVLLVNKLDPAQNNKHQLEDSLEAFIGAVYLDRGYERTRRLIQRKIIHNFINLKELEQHESNYKSQLIEWAQRFRKEVTFYTDLEPEDSTRFISYVSIGDTLFGSGTGLSKKEAEQFAALETLKELNLSKNG
ncbi:MAG: ribonuclease III [Bacteroidales bacterium]|nr:ribonuclease III [Bacteroidales bacterium]